MQSLDYVVLLIYLFAVLAAGLAFARTGTNTKSFFGAGGNAPWWISGLSLYMSFFSAGTFVVWGAIAYQHGWVAVAIQWCMCLAGLVTAIWIAPRWRRSGALTAAEFVQRRLGTGLQQFYSYIILVYGIFATGGVLYPVAMMVSVGTPFSLQASILVIGGMVVLYTAVGGLWAVMITDTLQFVILTVAVLAVVPLALGAVGGLDGFVRDAPEGFFTFTGGEYTWAFVLAFVFYSIFFLGGQWGFVQRYTSVPDERAARKVGLLYTALYLVSPIFWMLPPMAYRIMNPGLTGTAAEGAYILVSQAVLPVGVIGVVFAAMISATASTANTTLNITAAVFTHDIYRNLIRPGASERGQMIVARVSTVVCGLAVICIALLVPRMGGIVNLVLTMGALTGGPLLAPLIWSLFSRRLGTTGALAATLIGLGVSFGFKFLSPALFGFGLSRAAEMAVGVSIPVAVLVIAEVAAHLRGVTDPRFVTAFAPAAQTLVSHAEGTGEDSGSRFGVRVLAAMLGFVGVGLVLLAFFVPDRPSVPLAMGLCIAGVGALVWSLQARQDRIQRERSADERSGNREPHRPRATRV
jgi:solute:Na+ symporter, SSS family